MLKRQLVLTGLTALDAAEHVREPLPVGTRAVAVEGVEARLRRPDALDGDALPAILSTTISLLS